MRLRRRLHEDDASMSVELTTSQWRLAIFAELDDVYHWHLVGRGGACWGGTIRGWLRWPVRLFVADDERQCAAARKLAELDESENDDA